MSLKKHWILALVAASTMLSMTACDDDDDDDNGGNNQTIPQVYTDLPGTLITENTTWSSDMSLSGKYYVLPGVNLTIEAGVTVSFAYHNDNPDDVGAIITLRADATNFDTARPSAQLHCNGTADQPVVFTSGRGTKSAGDWGGIVLIGEAPNNISGGEGDVEGLSESIAYGGSNSSDDSGSLSYVRIEYCGFGIAAGSELNGLSLYSCGSGTTLDHVQVYKCTDDGFEWFGGNVSAKYLVSMYNDDDSFDMDEGWRGNGQFWFAMQAPGADNGFESDGRKTLGSGDATRPILSNVTLYGFGAGKDAEDKNYGMRLREDFEGELSNFLIANYAGINWKLESGDGDATSDNYDNDLLTITNTLIYNNDQDGAGDFGGFNSEADSMRFCDAATNNMVYPMDFFNDAAGMDFTPWGTADGSGVSPSGSWFTSVDFIGAIDPSNDWTQAAWVRWND